MPGRANKPHTTAEDILTTRQSVDIANAAAYLGVSHKTVRRLIAEGKLPAFRVAGRAIRVHADDVEALKEPVAVNH